MDEPSFRSPLRVRHGQAARLRRVGRLERGGITRLLGQREMKWPMVALEVQQDLGACRHALSQMVVAGTMTVYPPVYVSPSPDGSGDETTTHGE